MPLPAFTASRGLSSSRAYGGIATASRPTGVAPAVDLASCATKCAPAAVGCVAQCGTDLWCWLRCGGRAAATCLLACVDP